MFPVLIGAGVLAFGLLLSGCSSSGGSSPRPSDGGGDSGSAALASAPPSASGTPPVRPPNPLVTGVSPTTVERNLGTVPEASSRGDALARWVNDQLTQSYFDDFRAIYDPEPSEGKMFSRDHAREALEHFYANILPARLPTLRVTYTVGTTSTTLPNNITSDQLRQAVLARIIREFPDTRPAESAGAAGAGDAGAPSVGAPIAVPAGAGSARPRVGGGNGHSTPRPPTGPDIFY